MTIGSIVRIRPVPVLYGLTIASLVALLPLPPLLQNQAYHQFADQRELFGIPNFWNVVSNLPFIAVAPVGLLRSHRDATTTVLFAGIFLTGFGSSYYHLDPNDSTLFWDRLPMTICFAAILSAVVEERVDAHAGAMLFAAAVGHRHFQPFAMALDRRFAALCLGAVLSFPFLSLPWSSSSHYFRRNIPGTRYWVIAAALYALAKLLEFFDEKIFSFGAIVSGHTPKHLAAAAASLAILRLLQTRRPIITP
jgi:hypothetical protein